LERAAAGGYAGWFEYEQLTPDEMLHIGEWVEHQAWDLVLSHTCPISWEPRDLFLPFIDQSKVDKSMELWMEQIKDTFIWRYWCFGHFHDDRIVNENARMFYYDIVNLEDVLAAAQVGDS
jgi:3-oxoacid CoA-transferase subunit A